MEAFFSNQAWENELCIALNVMIGYQPSQLFKIALENICSTSYLISHCYERNSSAT